MMAGLHRWRAARRAAWRSWWMAHGVGSEEGALGGGAEERYSASVSPRWRQHHDISEKTSCKAVPRGTGSLGPSLQKTPPSSSVRCKQGSSSILS